MIDTNALMTAAFTLIAQFHSVISVPREQIPQRREDCDRVIVGSPRSPFDIYVWTRKGTSYSIEDGAICRYETANSCTRAETLTANFMGVSKLSSNEVLSLVVTNLERLIKNGTRLTNGSVKVSRVGEVRGSPVPWYTVTWHRSNSKIGFDAEVVMDARSGDIGFVWLRDKCFKDSTRAEEIRTSVFTADPEIAVGTSAKKQRVLPFPQTNEVVHAISRWLGVCGKLGMNPGSHTNLADLDWGRSCVFTNRKLSAIKAVHRIYFRNGTGFDSFGGAIISCELSDKYYGSKPLKPEYWNQFRGKTQKRCKDLAKDLETVLKTRFGVDSATLSQFTAGPSIGDFNAEVGSDAITRVVVAWRKWPELRQGESTYVPMSASRFGFAVEFDTQDGQIKGFVFQDPELIELFGRGQGETK